MGLPECYFFRLPTELKLEIIGYLDCRRDIYNASRTCQWLEAVTLKELYRDVHVHIPFEKSPAWTSGRYLRLRDRVVQVIRDITIRDGHQHGEQPLALKRQRSKALDAQSYAMQIVEDIPRNSLKAISFQHRNPISSPLLELLKVKHGRSLRHFACYEIDVPALQPSACLSGLESIHCRVVNDGTTLARLVSGSKETLTSLRIGEEKILVESYNISRAAIWDSIPPRLEDFQKVVSLHKIPHLRTLALTGLDLRAMVPSDIESALYLTNLQELTIETCVGVPEFLSAITSIFIFAQSEACPEPKPIPMLESFFFRHEATSTAIRDGLLHFLSSFSGLRMLSLMLENGSMSLKPAEIIANHGPSLEQLVLESRVQPRELLRLDTSRPFGMGGYSQQLWEEGTKDICRLCPNLRELGIGFPWNDEMVRIRQSPLPSLKNLSTMHIRNFPESPNLLRMGDYTIKEHATKFVEWTYANITDVKPQLETLSIGPTIYESRFVGSNLRRQQPPEFLRTHHFMIDWARTRFGRWSAMVTPVSEKYMEELRVEKPIDGVFRQVWLR